MPSKAASPDPSPADPNPAAILLRAAKENRFPHSVILTGKDMAALQSVAETLAETLLRGEASDTPSLQHHPDLFTVRPAKKMRQISADATRELIRNISHSPSAGPRKVAIVHEADRMHASAFNIFLKTLEEPPSDTAILLLTTQLYSLLPTIRSRCLIFRFPEKTGAACPPAIAEWLHAYREWLETIAGGLKQPSEIARATLTLFGLVARFQNVLAGETAGTWEATRETLPPDMDADAKNAMEESIKTGIRHRLFQDIEGATHAFARDLATREETFPTEPLTAAVARLETCAGLLRANLKEQVALEYFLLHSLRIWAKR